MKNYHKTSLQNTIDALFDVLEGYKNELLDIDPNKEPQQYSILKIQISQLESTIKLLVATANRADRFTEEMLTWNVCLN